jgi:concanavalin A-like lectin/glucanase superfamily protein
MKCRPSGDVGGISVSPTGQLEGTIWYTKTNAFNFNSGTVTVPLETWTHVALSWGSAGAKLYRNGVLVGSHPNTGSFADWFGVNSLFVFLGSGDSIDELRVSNIQRTSFNLPVPALAISLVSTNVLLAWPQSAAGFHLQSAIGSLFPGLWNDVTNAPTLVGGRFEVTMPATNGSQYFRLINY